jgi:hypothetical protein
MRYRTNRGKRGCLDISFTLSQRAFCMLGGMPPSRLVDGTRSGLLRTTSLATRSARGSWLDARLTIISRSLQLERNLECQILLCDCPDINVPDSTRVRNDRLEFNGIDERFFQSDILDTGIVESVNIVPDCGSAPCFLESSLAQTHS